MCTLIASLLMLGQPEYVWTSCSLTQALVPTAADRTHDGYGAGRCRAGTGSMCASSGAPVHLGGTEAALCRPLKLGLQPLHPAQDSFLQDGQCVSLIECINLSKFNSCIG